MDVDTLRAFAQGVQMAVTGVPITVTRPAPDDDPIATTGIWLARPLDEANPIGMDLQRRDPRKVMAIVRSDTLSALPRGTTILAPELIGGVVRNWQMDGLPDPTIVDEWRVILKLIADP